MSNQDSNHILVAVAWPYASSEIHVGNIAGSYLPADTFARYHRLKGNRVLMVSGSDAHGTPITVRADTEGVADEVIYRRFHTGFIQLFQQLGLTYDLFTSTHTENHFKVSQAIFLALKENGYLYTASEQQWYSEEQERFLPDRYVEGTCAVCGNPNARSDQCERCGTLLELSQLLEPRSKVDGSTPVRKETEHFYLDLSKLESRVIEFLEARQSYWRPNVVKQSLGQMRANPLRGRAITRDLDWGIPVPVEGWEGKRLYVWFEAVIGYLSAAIEWAHLNSEPEAWQNWWTNPGARAYYFIGKDNIPFHAVMWPAQLIGVGETFLRLFAEVDGKELILPFDVPANEFLNLEDRKISGSQNWGVWGLDFLTRYDPDPLRFYLTMNSPETRDGNWDWAEFVARNNNELVATWGNLANRVLSFAYKHWDGRVPTPGELSSEDEALLSKIEAGFGVVGDLIEQVKLRSALQEALALATEVNKYLDVSAPWSLVKTDRAAAGTRIFCALKAIDSLKTIFAPFLPFSSQQLHYFFGYTHTLFGASHVGEVSDGLGAHATLQYDGRPAAGRWKPSGLAPGTELNQPAPLFKKLDESVIELERARLGTPGY
ncbi:MAG: methionine--tRNA ligase [Chloroflexi bacterium]|nr:methionine--tRNA ligase [Chloroflexota bacterium]